MFPKAVYKNQISLYYIRRIHCQTLGEARPLGYSFSLTFSLLCVISQYHMFLPAEHKWTAKVKFLVQSSFHISCMFSGWGFIWAEGRQLCNQAEQTQPRKILVWQLLVSSSSCLHSKWLFLSEAGRTNQVHNSMANDRSKSQDKSLPLWFLGCNFLGSLS